MSLLQLTGVTVTDVRGTRWKIGTHIGSGGFGSIFVADEVPSISSAEKSGTNPTAIKVEPHNNGSLFTEMHFYHRTAKIEKMEEWQRQRELDYVGMPRFHGSGSFTHRKHKYRFIVIDRYGTDLQTVLGMNDGRMSLKTALTVAIRVTDILEYIHFHGYVHKDVKAQNLLLGFEDPNKVFLVDFGLACRYFVYESGFEVHKEFREDMRRAHDGTIEFTSRDGHIGALSRRSDLEVLLYNLLYWISGKLPWSSNREDADFIATQKGVYMSDPHKLMVVCFGRKGAPPYILDFANYVSRLEFHEKPNYELCREMFKQAILKSGFRHDMLLQFGGNEGVHRVQTKRRCRKSFQIEKEKRQKIDAECQNSLSGSSRSSVHKRTRSRGNNLNATNGHDQSDVEDDSSTSDRPSSVRRSCFDSRQSSGRRTGTNLLLHEGGGSGHLQNPSDTVIILESETKKSHTVSPTIIKRAQLRLCEQEELLIGECRLELAELEETENRRKRKETSHVSNGKSRNGKVTIHKRKKLSSKDTLSREGMSLRHKRLPLAEKFRKHST